MLARELGALHLVSAAEGVWPGGKKNARGLRHPPLAVRRWVTCPEGAEAAAAAGWLNGTRVGSCGFGGRVELNTRYDRRDGSFFGCQALAMQEVKLLGEL